jgi:hypothetical protein
VEYLKTLAQRSPEGSEKCYVNFNLNKSSLADFKARLSLRYRPLALPVELNFLVCLC